MSLVLRLRKCEIDPLFISMYLKTLFSYHVDNFDTHANFKDFMATATLQSFSEFNCKVLLLNKYLNAKDISSLSPWNSGKNIDH